MFWDIWIFVVSGKTDFFEESVGAFQTVGLGLLTLMVPLGVAILQEFITADKREMPKLDIRVLRTLVFQSRKFLTALVLLLLVPIGWGIFNNIIWNVILLLGWGLGALTIILLLQNFWHWVGLDEENIWILRKRYLKETFSLDDKSHKEQLSVWKEIWLFVKKNRSYEYFVAKIFIEILKKQAQIIRKEQDKDKKEEYEFFMGSILYTTNGVTLDDQLFIFLVEELNEFDVRSHLGGRIQGTIKEILLRSIKKDEIDGLFCLYDKGSDRLYRLPKMKLLHLEQVLNRLKITGQLTLTQRKEIHATLKIIEEKQ